MKKMIMLSFVPLFIMGCAKEEKVYKVIPEGTNVQKSASPNDTFGKKFEINGTDESKWNLCQTGSGNCLSTVVITPGHRIVMDALWGKINLGSSDALSDFFIENSATLDDYFSLDVIDGIINQDLTMTTNKINGTQYVQVFDSFGSIAVYPLI